MNIEKQTSYKCNLTNEENKILEKASSILSELLKHMNNVQCGYADCTQYPEMPEGVSFSKIEDAKTTLGYLQFLKEIHG